MNANEVIYTVYSREVLSLKYFVLYGKLHMVTTVVWNHNMCLTKEFTTQLVKKMVLTNIYIAVHTTHIIAVHEATLQYVNMLKLYINLITIVHNSIMLIHCLCMVDSSWCFSIRCNESEEHYNYQQHNYCTMGSS